MEHVLVDIGNDIIFAFIGTLFAYLARRFKGGIKFVLAVVGGEAIWIYVYLLWYIGMRKRSLTFEPIDADLAASLKALAQKVGFPEDGFRIVNNNQVVNAFFSGIWPLKVILIYTGMLVAMPPEQVVAIMAHELGHWNYSHLAISLMVHITLQAMKLSLARQYMAREGIFKDMEFSAYPPLLIRYMQFQPIKHLLDFLLRPVEFGIQQLKEYQADRYAKNLGYAQNLQEALITLAKQEGYEEVSIYHWLYAIFNASHPTIPMRIRALN